MGTRGVEPGGGGHKQDRHSPCATKPFGHGLQQASGKRERPSLSSHLHVKVSLERAGGWDPLGPICYMWENHQKCEHWWYQYWLLMMKMTEFALLFWWEVSLQVYSPATVTVTQKWQICHLTFWRCLWSSFFCSTQNKMLDRMLQGLTASVTIDLHCLSVNGDWSCQTSFVLRRR